MTEPSLYERLGGYDGITAFASDLMPRLQRDSHHVGMKISESDWDVFLGHAGATVMALRIPERESTDVVGFVLSLKDDIVEG